MSKSVEARDVLKALAAGGDVKADPDTVSELLSLGLVAPLAGAVGGAPAVGDDLGAIRQHMSALGSEQETLRAQLEAFATGAGGSPGSLYRQQPAYKKAQDRLDEIERDLRSIRTRYLGLVQAAAERHTAGALNGRAHRVTYKGQEALQTLEQRTSRLWATDIRSFVEEVDATRAHFDSRAARAEAILKLISPANRSTDEIHLRLASVGLAGREGTPEEAARLFTKAYTALSAMTSAKETALITVAETAVMAARDEAGVDRLVGSARGLLATPWGPNFVREDQVRATAILVLGGADIPALVQRTVQLTGSYCPGWPSAGALLAISERAGAGPALLGNFTALRDAIYTSSTGAVDITVAAALMAVSQQDVAATVERYRAAMGALGRFNGAGMEVPSAMVAMLPYGVEEAMDNVRLAAAAIMAHRLSLGGAENLSLGVKMLMQSSVEASVGQDAPGQGPAGLPGPRAMPAVPRSMAIVGLTAATAAGMVVGLLAFHELSLHRFAVRDYAFHPVHAHHVYG